MKNIIAIVTGGSSGIGRETAVSLRNMGCKVYEFSRRSMPLENIIHITADVTSEASVKAAVEAVVKNEGKIDILVNCAGFGISGAVEFTHLSDAKAQFDVNFFGTVNVTNAVLPIMRANGNGRIVNISSVAAVAHIPFQAFYSASKAAIDSYTAALNNEIKPFGITVTSIQPGDICTSFTDSRKKENEGDNIYNNRISKSVSKMEKDEMKGISPSVAGKYIAKIALKKNVKTLYAIGGTYKILSVLCKVVPCSLRDFIVGKLYAGL